MEKAELLPYIHFKESIVPEVFSETFFIHNSSAADQRVCQCPG